MEEIIRKNILRYLPQEQINDICDFVEELYLMEYDLLILMARKFFNFFFVFHDLNCEKYMKMGIPFQHEKIIITNNAIPVLKPDIQKGDYSRIIIADDIIIHGRTISDLYEQLLHIAPKHTMILLESYGRKKEKSIFLEQLEDKIHVRYYLEEQKRKALSDQIVRTFYMSGRPYIAYVPCFYIELPHRQLIDAWKKEKEEFYDISSLDMKNMNLYAYSYAGRELKRFRELPVCDVCCIRVYFYEDIKRTILIPYVHLNAMNDEQVEKLSAVLRALGLRKSYLQKVEGIQKEYEFRVREAEYCISSWLAMLFLHKTGIRLLEWDKQIETYNFSDWILEKDILDEKRIEEKLLILQNFSLEQKKVEDFTPDSRELESRYHEVVKNYLKSVRDAEGKRSWNSDENVDEVQGLIERLLQCNGQLDEERFLEQKPGRKRLLGYPLSFVIHDVSKKMGISPNRVFAACLTACDSGKGTIVKRTIINQEGKSCTESVLHAGEQNYKFFENMNFPILYGFYELEQRASRKRTVYLLDDWKKKLLGKYIDYMKKNGIFYVEKEVCRLSTIPLGKQYGEYILHSFKKYRNNKCLNYILDEVDKICG